MPADTAVADRGLLEEQRQLRQEQELKRRVGPLLPDGARLSECVNLDDREVSMRVVSDPEIYRLEMERIFNGAWIAVGHESEIPNAGDFVLRYAGEDPVIVSRTADGVVRAVLNICSHRGMEICWAEEGNQSSFKCPYHGWVFDGAGKLLGAPFEKNMYPGWDKSKYSLSVARVALRHGLIFVNFDEKAPSFEDYAGDMLWYIDYQFGNVEWEPAGPIKKTLINANWKLLVDQLAGDALHAVALHHSLIEMGFQSPEATFLDHVKVTLPPSGHSVFTINPTNPPADDPYTIEGRGFTSVLFPTTGMISSPGGMGMGSSQSRTAGLFLHVPRGPDAFEHWQLFLVPKGSSTETKRQLAKTITLTDALVLVDDSQQGPSMQRMAKLNRGARQPMRYFSRGGTIHPKNWPGPGIVHAGYSKDETSWEFWKRWYDLMTAQEN